MKDKKTLLIDMDGVVADYNAGFKTAIQKNPELVYPQSQYGFFLQIFNGK